MYCDRLLSRWRTVWKESGSFWNLPRENQPIDWYFFQMKAKVMDESINPPYLSLWFPSTWPLVKVPPSPHQLPPFPISSSYYLSVQAISSSSFFVLLLLRCAYIFFSFFFFLHFSSPSMSSISDGFVVVVLLLYSCKNMFAWRLRKVKMFKYNGWVGK